MVRYLHLVLVPQVCPEERQRGGVRGLKRGCWEHSCWEVQSYELSTA